MRADTPDIDGPTRANRCPLEERSGSAVPADGGLGVPVRRIGLEQEFFVVDRTGALCDLADLFLRRWWEAAEAGGLDPGCVKPECVKGMVEITTPPSSGFEDLAKNYLSNLNLALEVASDLGLALYPLGTYPLPIMPVVRDHPSYRVQASTIGYNRFLNAGRCAGTHLHLELPAGTVWPDVNMALDAPAVVREELLDLYNLATALDPALVALTRACPFYEGGIDGLAARTVHYRGIFGLDGVYTNVQEVGALSAYASCVKDLADQQRARYVAWFAAMDLAGVERRLFASTGGAKHRASWNPVRLNHHGTLEIRSMDSNYPEVILRVCSLICGAVDRVRSQHLKVRPSHEVRTVQLDGDVLLVPHFSYLSGELLSAAITGGVNDHRIKSYLDSVIGFASAFVEEPEAIGLLDGTGIYETTESEILKTFSPLRVSVTRYEGLLLVREACRRLKEQVSSLHHRHDQTPQASERNPGGAND